MARPMATMTALNRRRSARNALVSLFLAELLLVDVLGLASAEVVDRGTLQVAPGGEAQTNWTHVQMGNVVHWQTSADAYVLHIAEIRGAGFVDSSDGGGLADCFWADADLEFRLRWLNNAVPNPRLATASYSIAVDNETGACPSATQAISAFRASQQPVLWIDAGAPWLVLWGLIGLGITATSVCVLRLSPRRRNRSRGGRQ